MSLLSQKTLKKTATFSGVGLHNGKLAKVLVKPSEPNTGIVFKRVDLQSNNYVYPSFTNVTNTLLNTTISNEHGVKVSTIEHLMGALFGLGIDNALVEINNEEVPILDGSAKEFIENLKSCGLEKSEAPIKIIKIQKKITFHQGEKFISIEPSKLSLDISFKLKFEDCLIGNQENKINVYEDDLIDIFNSRTFCLFEDIEKILEFKTWTNKDKIDKLLEIDCSLYAHLGSDSKQYERDDVRKKSIDIYRTIKKIDRRLGDEFLLTMDLKQ